MARAASRIPPAPADLSPAAVARWKAVAAQLVDAGPIDLVTLATYCRVWVRWQEAESAIAKVGSLIKNDKGRAQSNPYLAVSRAASREVRALEDRLGLGADRSRDAALEQAAGRLLTRRDLAQLLGVHMQTVTKWEHEGLPIASRGRRGRASKYRAVEVRTWLSAREAAATPAAGPTGGALNVLQERARRERAQAVLAEQTVATRARDLLPAAEVERVWSMEIAAVRAAILATYTTQADRVCNAAVLEGVAGVEAELKAIAYELLEQLAADRPVDLAPAAPVDAQVPA